MSKITFRADDDLVEELETFETSKSEVMRRALREYLEASDGADEPTETEQTSLDTPDDADREGGLDDLVAARIDELIEQRVDDVLDERLGAGAGDAAARPDGRSPQDVNVNVTVEDARAPAADDAAAADECKTRRRADARAADGDGRLRDPNVEDGRGQTCGQCGESVDGDHVYCPNCGEKATRRVFCECGDELRSDWGFCPGCGRRTAAADVLDSS